VKNFYAFALAVFGTVFALSLAADPAQAQVTRTWVSGTGDDGNTCSRTAPCKTFAGAISQTAAGGQINCLDPAGFGVLTINKSITIDCHEEFASVLVSGSNAITINFDAFADSFKTVNLRNLGIDGTGGAGSGIIISGDGTGSFVNIEGGFINHFAGGGIVDGRKNGALAVSNTTVTNNSGTGISMASSGGTLQETLTGVRVDNTNYGVIAGPGVKIMISRSVISHNATAGLFVTGTGAQMIVDSSVITSNAIGLNATGGTMMVSNNDVEFNTTATSITGVFSFGSNRFAINGTTPSVVLTGLPDNRTGEQ
jgi:hypothetical protein